MILKSEKNKLNCCSYHFNQNYTNFANDINCVVSVIDNITTKIQCKKCKYIRVYVAEINNPIKTLL